ncbi:MAG: carbohydrate kinase [Gemmatimonadetes bacterium]|nr:carbohydrate kinase [Gemmatimonadota bacterium]MYD24856.1 carbohydrate kinase [Gemmatimonadota bacterium]MYI98572.1 carbohydrate kinase [Gemmatimonadota bacterium]
MLPSGPQLGGAPANFAYFASLLGEEGIVASRVGRDDLGDRAVDRIAGLGLSTDAIQRDEHYPTGTVDVALGPDGQPEFTINGDVAWEHMAWTPGWSALAARTDAVCFGTVCRHQAASTSAVTAFLKALRPSALRLFDVNLRQDRYTPALLHESFQHAHIVKLNDEELRTVCPLLDLGGVDLESMARQLRERYELEVVCVTRGAEGSLLVTASETVAHPGVPVDVVDTIGAGDAFTAVLASGYLRVVPLERVSVAANRLGAWVASRTGAMPAADEAVCSAVRNTLREA